MTTQSMAPVDRCASILSELERKEPRTTQQVADLLLWGYYAPQTFAEFGMGYQGCVLRQRADSCLLTVKVVESGTPLVGFVSASTTTGSIERLFDALFEYRVKWQRDKYPWI